MSINIERLEGIVRSIKETRSELQYQIERVGGVATDIESEAEHLADLYNGYNDAHRYLGILLNYQEGRLNRERGR